MLVALNAGSDVASFSAPAVEGAWQPVFGEAPAAEGEGAGALHVGPIAGRVWRRDR